MDTVSACLIIIGNEILSGRTQDKNLAYIAMKLNDVGVRLLETRVIPDIELTIVDTLNECRQKFDYILTTGGIGPTHDDITSAAVAKAFGVKLIRHPEAVEILKLRYANTDVPLNEARLKMADVPEGSRLIANGVSGAPGFALGNVFVMAGVPAIMQSMLESVVPQLKGAKPMVSSSFTTNITEGTLADGLTLIQHKYADIEIGSYPRFRDGAHSTTLVFHSPSPERNAAARNEAEALIKHLGGKILADA